MGMRVVFVIVCVVPECLCRRTRCADQSMAMAVPVRVRMSTLR